MCVCVGYVKNNNKKIIICILDVVNLFLSTSCLSTEGGSSQFLNYSVFC